MECQRCKCTDCVLNVNSKRINKTGVEKFSHLCRSCNTERHLRYRKTKNGAKRQKAAVLAYEARNPDRRKAYSAVQHALAKGTLVRPDNCSSCDETKPVDAHHHDYSKPLDVQWVCRQCHAEEHRIAA